MAEECEIVSVVVPVYNGEKYLKKCLDSILCQSYKAIEILCIDDGSTDCSYKILKEYEGKAQQINVVSQSNQGVSAARNTGIRCATGKYITFIDCDDYIEERYIENLVQHMKNKNDIVITGFIDEKIDQCIENNIFMHNCVWNLENGIREKLMTDTVSPHTFSFLNVKRDIGFSSGKLYLRSFIQENHIWFDEEIKLCEDLLFFLICELYATKIEYICSEEKAWYHYVFHSDSSSNKKDYFRYREQEKYIKKLYEVSRKMHKLGIEKSHYIQAVYVTTVKMLASDFKQYFYEKDFPAEIHVQRTLVSQLIRSEIWTKAIQLVKLKNIKNEHGRVYLYFIIICCRYRWTYMLEGLVRTYKYLTNSTFQRKKQNFNLQQCKRVLVIVAGAWGDTTMMIPFFKLLRQQCYDAEIVSLCVTEIARINLKEFNLIDKIIKIPTEISGGKNICRHPLALRRFIKQINTYQAFDLAICLSSSMGLSAMMHLIKANAYAGYSRLRWKVFWDYATDWNARKHYVDKFLGLLEELGCPVQNSHRIPLVDINEANMQKGKEFILKNNLNNKYIIGIGTGASCMTRKWTQFKQLIMSLNETTDIAILLFGSSAEAEEIDDIISEVHFRERIVRIICDINELKNYISVCNLIIGNDSGFSHYGAACGIDTIQIRGCVKGSTTGARGSGRVIILEDDKLECRGKEESICPKGTYECLAHITAIQVENVVLELLYQYKNSMR